MNYLCLDYGKRNIGIALADSPLAEPLLTLTSKNIFSELPKLIRDYQIGELIIGNCPTDFFARLNEFDLPIIQVDETLSTKDATIALFHTTKSRRKTQIHAVSAAIILQNYLDSKPQKP